MVLSVAVKKAGEKGLAARGAGFGFEGGEAVESLGMFGVDFQDAAIERDSPPGEAHGFVEFAELEVGGSVPLVELDGQIKVMDGVLAILGEGGEAACEHGVMLGDVGSELDAFAKPEQRAGEIFGA